MSNLENHITLLESSVLKSAAYMRSFFASNAEVSFDYKNDDSIVMNVDIESQRIMLSDLGSALPIVAEEDPASHALIHSSADYFLVDPLDGTTSAKRYRNILGGQIGFGPLGGIVHGGKLVAAVFFNLPALSLITAVRGGGVWKQKFPTGAELLLPRSSRTKVVSRMPELLRLCGVLFYPGTKGEIRIIEQLRDKNIIENVYRFGGFANDCARIAHGFEQVQVQFSVKPWDFSAALFCVEAGLDVILDPMKRRVDFADWKIELENPVITVPKPFREELFKFV